MMFRCFYILAFTWAFSLDLHFGYNHSQGVFIQSSESLSSTSASPNHLKLKYQQADGAEVGFTYPLSQFTLSGDSKSLHYSLSASDSLTLDSIYKHDGSAIWVELEANVIQNNAGVGNSQITKTATRWLDPSNGENNSFLYVSSDASGHPVFYDWSSKKLHIRFSDTLQTLNVGSGRIEIKINASNINFERKILFSLLPTSLYELSGKELILDASAFSIAMETALRAPSSNARVFVSNEAVSAEDGRKSVAVPENRNMHIEQKSGPMLFKWGSIIVPENKLKLWFSRNAKPGATSTVSAISLTLSRHNTTDTVLTLAASSSFTLNGDQVVLALPSLWASFSWETVKDINLNMPAGTIWGQDSDGNYSSEATTNESSISVEGVKPYVRHVEFQETASKLRVECNEDISMQAISPKGVVLYFTQNADGTANSITINDYSRMSVNGKELLISLAGAELDSVLAFKNQNKSLYIGLSTSFLKSNYGKYNEEVGQGSLQVNFNSENNNPTELLLQQTEYHIGFRYLELFFNQKVSSLLDENAKVVLTSIRSSSKIELPFVTSKLSFNTRNKHDVRLSLTEEEHQKVLGLTGIEYGYKLQIDADIFKSETSLKNKSVELTGKIGERQEPWISRGYYLEDKKEFVIVMAAGQKLPAGQLMVTVLDHDEDVEDPLSHPLVQVMQSSLVTQTASGLTEREIKIAVDPSLTKLGNWTDKKEQMFGFFQSTIPRVSADGSSGGSKTESQMYLTSWFNSIDLPQIDSMLLSEDELTLSVYWNKDVTFTQNVGESYLLLESGEKAYLKDLQADKSFGSQIWDFTLTTKLNSRISNGVIDVGMAQVGPKNWNLSQSVVVGQKKTETPTISFQIEGLAAKFAWSIPVEGTQIQVSLFLGQTKITETSSEGQELLWYPLVPGEYTLQAFWKKEQIILKEWSETVTVKALAKAEEAEQTGWAMGAFVPEALKGTFYTWKQENKGFFDSYSVHDKTSKLSFWQGGWVALEDGFDLTRVPFRALETLTLPSNKKGWIQIGNPYPYALKLPAALLGKAYLWKQDIADYVPATEKLESYQGCWVRLDGLNNVSFDTKPYFSSTVKQSQRIILSENWNLNLSSGNYIDNNNSFAWGKSKEEIREIPTGPGKKIALSFVGAEGYLQSQRVSNDKKEWEFVAFSQEAGLSKGVLSIQEGLQDLPDGHSFYLHDGEKWTALEGERSIVLHEDGVRYKLALATQKPIEHGVYGIRLDVSSKSIVGSNLQSTWIVNGTGQVIWQKQLVGLNVFVYPEIFGAHWIHVQTSDGVWKQRVEP